MTPQDAKQLLIRHGMLVFLLGLLTGTVVPWLTNPRMGVAAHVGGVMSGMFLILVGLLWEQIKLSLRAEKAAFWLFLYAAYARWLAQLLAAWFGTSRAARSLGLVA